VAPLVLDEIANDGIDILPKDIAIRENYGARPFTPVASPLKQ
jgi:hypothetical protein